MYSLFRQVFLLIWLREQVLVLLLVAFTLLKLTLKS